MDAHYSEKVITVVRHRFGKVDGAGRAIVSEACMSPAAGQRSFKRMLLAGMPGARDP